MLFPQGFLAENQECLAPPSVRRFPAGGADWHIEPLRPQRERAAFSCGQPSLDTFLATLVSQYEKRRLGRTYVAVEPGQVRVAGY
jgi:hypothetical protein